MNAARLRPRAVDLGGRPRVSYYNTPSGATVRGVLAAGQQNAAATTGRIAALSPVGLANAEARNAAGMTGIRGIRYAGVRPRVALGPLPKLSVGTGRTARQPATALGYTPGGYTPPTQVFSAGFEYMPFLQEDHRGAFPTVSATNPTGIPSRGVSADDGNVLNPRWHPHDWSTWVTRFQTQGRAPGAWQETSFPPGYRSLVRRRPPIGYNLSNAVALARPLSPAAYNLPWRTPANAAARIGGGSGRPLGYNS